MGTPPHFAANSYQGSFPRLEVITQHDAFYALTEGHNSRPHFVRAELLLRALVPLRGNKKPHLRGVHWGDRHYLPRASKNASIAIISASIKPITHPA